MSKSVSVRGPGYLEHVLENKDFARRAGTFLLVIASDANCDLDPFKTGGAFDPLTPLVDELPKNLVEQRPNVIRRYLDVGDHRFFAKIVLALLISHPGVALQPVLAEEWWCFSEVLEDLLDDGLIKEPEKPRSGYLLTPLGHTYLKSITSVM